MMTNPYPSQRPSALNNPKLAALLGDDGSRILIKVMEALEKKKRAEDRVRQELESQRSGNIFTRLLKGKKPADEADSGLSPGEEELRFHSIGSRRKHRVRIDDYGRSQRQACFYLFDKGKRPVEVARALKMKPATVFRYHADHLKGPGQTRLVAKFTKKALSRNPHYAADFVMQIAVMLGMTEDEVCVRLLRPWGLFNLLSGRWPNLRHERLLNKFEKRLALAYEIAREIESRGYPTEPMNSEGNQGKPAADISK